MTATIETTTFQPGDKVRLTRHVGGDMEEGDIGTVSHVDSHGDVTGVKIEGRRDGAWGPGDFAVNMRDIEKVEEEKPVELKVGDKVRIVAGSDFAQRWIGFVCTVEEPARAAAGSAWLKPDSDRPDGFKRSPFYWPIERLEKVESAPESHEPPEMTALRNALLSTQQELERARQEAQRERDALTSYKDFVRSKVIEEADEQGWCDRTDSWLEELGLEPRNYWGDLPRNMHAVVELTGNRIAMLKDHDNRPWYVTGIGSYEGQTGWWSGKDISDEYVRTLNEGDEGDTWDDHQD